MTACYIFNGNDKWLLSTGWLPAKLIGNCLLLEVEVLPGLEVCCWIGEGLSCRMGRGRNVGAVCPSVPLDRFLLEKWLLREPWLEICQSHIITPDSGSFGLKPCLSSTGWYFDSFWFFGDVQSQCTTGVQWLEHILVISPGGFGICQPSEPFCPLPKMPSAGDVGLWMYISAYQIEEINAITVFSCTFWRFTLCPGVTFESCSWLCQSSHCQPWISVLLMVRDCCCLGACQKETCSEMLIDQEYWLPSIIYFSPFPRNLLTVHTAKNQGSISIPT